MIQASVIIPAYNAGAKVATCLQALQRQTVPSDQFEVIVVDDGSTDNTVEQLRAWPVAVVSLPHGGPARARNAGAARARGAILIFTDADCEPQANWLEKMLEPFADPDVVAVKGAYLTRQTSLVARIAQLEFETRYTLLKKHRSIDMVDTYSGAFRREAFEKVGGFDPSFPVANNEDVDLSYRVAALGHTMRFAPEAIVYHTHPATWWKYARIKFGRGYWRTAVYRQFVGKAFSDTYTPHSLKLQVLALGGLLGSLVLALLSPWFLVASGLAVVLFLLACLPFYRQARQYDPALAPIVPLWLFLRAAALGFGTAAGIVKPPLKTKSSSQVTFFIVIHMLGDILLLYLATQGATWFHAQWTCPHPTLAAVTPETSRGVALFYVILWFIILLANGTYFSQRGKLMIGHVFNILRVNAESLALLAIFYFLAPRPVPSHSWLAGFIVLNTGLLAAEKLLLYSILRHLRGRGLNVKNILLVGNREDLADPLRRIQMASEAGFHVIGLLTLRKAENNARLMNVPILGTIADLDRILHEHAVEEVLFAPAVLSLPEFESSLAACLRMGKRGKVMANIFHGMATRVTTARFLGLPVLSFLPRPERRLESKLKSLVDLSIALLVLLLLSPLMLLIALLLLATGRGPVLIPQERIGFHGRIFTHYKFRTLREPVEESSPVSPDAGSVQDRVYDRGPDQPTGIGRLLQTLHLDELPQFWNVLMGEMSLVGPCPLSVDEARMIQGDLRRRLSMKPGLTGLWYCEGRDLTNHEEWLRLDLQYVDRWSLGLDVTVFLKSLLTLFRRRPR